MWLWLLLLCVDDGDEDLVQSVGEGRGPFIHKSWASSLYMLMGLTLIGLIQRSLPEHVDVDADVSSVQK